MTVYFIQQDYPYGPVKIGTAIEPLTRLGELQVGNPKTLTLLYTLPGGREVEAKLHNEFAPLHIRGEWYKYLPWMLNIVKRLEATLANLVKSQSIPTACKQRQRPINWKACRHCGATTRRHAYCSSSCKSRARTLRRMERAAPCQES
jgi:hypothetical protein